MSTHKFSNVMDRKALGTFKALELLLQLTWDNEALGGLKDLNLTHFQVIWWKHECKGPKLLKSTRRILLIAVETYASQCLYEGLDI
jgi:hypothetical protein